MQMSWISCCYSAFFILWLLRHDNTISRIEWSRPTSRMSINFLFVLNRVFHVYLCSWDLTYFCVKINIRKYWHFTGKINLLCSPPCMWICPLTLFEGHNNVICFSNITPSSHRLEWRYFIFMPTVSIVLKIIVIFKTLIRIFAINPRLG